MSRLISDFQREIKIIIGGWKEVQYLADPLWQYEHLFASLGSRNWPGRQATGSNNDDGILLTGIDYIIIRKRNGKVVESDEVVAAAVVVYIL